MFVRLALMLLLLLASAGTSLAQTGAIVSWEVQFYMPGVDPATGAPFTTLQIPRAAIQCAPAPTPPMTAVVNPTHISWAGNPGERCQVDQSQVLLGLPIGGEYLATMTALNDVNRRSPRSAASNPFSLLPDPAVPQEVRLTR